MSTKLPTRKERKSKLVRQTGIRYKFLDAVDDAWSSHPRKTLVNHKADWYTDGHLAKGRPLFGILALSNYAEYLLHHAMYGRRGQSKGLIQARRFFAATRTAMFHVLRHTSGQRPLSAEFRNALRNRISSMIDLAREARSASETTKETQSV